MSLAKAGLIFFYLNLFSRALGHLQQDAAIQ